MTDDLIARLRRADEYEPLGHVGWEAADRLEAAEAKIARASAAWKAFGDANTIDAHWLAVEELHAALQGEG